MDEAARPVFVLESLVGIIWSEIFVKEVPDFVSEAEGSLGDFDCLSLDRPPIEGIMFFFWEVCRSGGCRESVWV